MALDNAVERVPHEQYADTIRKYSALYKVDPKFASAIMHIESAGNPRAVSPVGAQGLFQLMPDTAKGLGVTNPLDPEQNIRGGVRYLSQLQAQFGNHPDLVAAAFNAGPGAVRQYGGVPPFRETQEYVKRMRSHIGGEHLQKLSDRRGLPVRPGQGGPSPVTSSRGLPVKPGENNPVAQSSRGLPIPVNPMDNVSNPDPVQDAVSSKVQSGLSTLAGHQDLPFILINAQLRDADTKTGVAPSMFSLLRDPNSNTFKAYHLYLKNPGAAMDEYGLGSKSQAQFMVKHFPKSNEGKFAQGQLDHPVLNAAYTFFGEQANPMAWAEGGVAGRIADKVANIRGVKNAAQQVAHQTGFGSPLAKIDNRAGTQGVQAVKGLIASVKVPEYLTRKMTEQIFGGLTKDEQEEVWRLSQGSKPNPAFFKQYVNLKARADALRSDIKHVTNEKVRTGVLKPEEHQVHNPETYLPMSRAYDFGPQYELEESFRSSGTAGGGNTANKQKTFQFYDQAKASGLLDKDFSPAVAYSTWRRQGLQRVAFEDALNRLPETLRRDINFKDYGMAEQPWAQRPGESPFDATQRVVGEKNARLTPDHPEYMHVKDDQQWLEARKVLATIPSETLKKSMVAPELFEFLAKDGALSKFVGRSGSFLPGDENGWVQKFVAFARNMVVLNFVYHPAVNIAVNDSAARTLHNIGGNRFDAGGAPLNTLKAISNVTGLTALATHVAKKAGLKSPEAFTKGAKDYAAMYDRALIAGATAEPGVSNKSALGGDLERVLTERDPEKLLSRAKKAIIDRDPEAWAAIRQRVDKALTRANQFNMDRTFRGKGEEAFAVKLFADLVHSGASDADAGKAVREALGDYYNFDPTNPWSAGIMFMPWLKGNTKFWMNLLLRKPQVLAGSAHAIRNYNDANDDPRLYGQYPASDWSVWPRGFSRPWTSPFVGRDITHIANFVQQTPSDGPNAALTNLTPLVLGRANPIAKTASDSIQTMAAAFDPDLKGPETSFNLIFNPKAPVDVRWKQTAAYFAGKLPVPLAGYALQDAARRGWDPSEAATAVATAVGLGYGGQAKLSDDARRQLGQAKKKYLKAYYQYRDDKDASALHSAWDDYISTLQDLGVVH